MGKLRSAKSPYRDIVNSDQTSSNAIISVTNYATQFSDKLNQLKKKYKKSALMIMQMKKIYKETTDLLNHAIVSYQCFLSYLLHGTVHSHKHLLIDLKTIFIPILSRSNGKKNNWTYLFWKSRNQKNKNCYHELVTRESQCTQPQ